MASSDAARATSLLRQKIHGLKVRVVAPAAGDDIGLHAELRCPVNKRVNGVPR
jgi:hypothetical protein